MHELLPRRIMTYHLLTCNELLSPTTSQTQEFVASFMKRLSFGGARAVRALFGVVFQLFDLREAIEENGEKREAS